MSKKRTTDQADVTGSVAEAPARRTRQKSKYLLEIKIVDGEHTWASAVSNEFGSADESEKYALTMGDGEYRVVVVKREFNVTVETVKVAKVTRK